MLLAKGSSLTWRRPPAESFSRQNLSVRAPWDRVGFMSRLFRDQRSVSGALLLAGFLLLPCGKAGTLRAQTTLSVVGTVANSSSAGLPDNPVPVSPEDSAAAGTITIPSIEDDAQTTQSTAGDTSRKQQGPTLEDLGLAPDQVKANPDLQARLDRRTHMLKVHQRLGILTLAPLAAACISSAAAPPDPKNGKGNTVGRDLHVSLGSLSVSMYAATAYYAIRAPKVSDQPARGGIKLHKYLIYIHAPGMVLTPILGAMAFNQANSGEKVHGIASAHAAVAWTTVASYSAAIVAVSWPIHLKF
jgi:hypothetical protein